MPASVQARTTRYFRPELTQVIIATTPFATLGSPLRAEINAAVNISNNVQTVSGFSVSTEQLGTPDWGTRFTSQIPGRINAEDSSITTWADKLGVDIRDLVARDQDVDVLFMDVGDTAGRPMDAYRCVVASLSQPRDGDSPATFVVSFSIRDYAEGLAVPA